MSALFGFSQAAMNAPINQICYNIGKQSRGKTGKPSQIGVNTVRNPPHYSEPNCQMAPETRGISSASARSA